MSIAIEPRRALVIGAKEPVPGTVKTRLGRTIGDARAAALYRAFLADIAARFRPTATASGAARGYDVLWAFAPATADFPALVGAADGYFAQQGADWTERQQQIFRWTAAHGYDRTVLIASDSPQLPARTVSAAFAALDASMAVLVPTYDGGYSLIGQRGGVDILGVVPMSTTTVYDDLRANARARRITLHSLAVTWDVDEVGDFQYLSTYLAGPHDAPATAAAVRHLRLWEDAAPRSFVPRPDDRLSAAGGED
ncbi:MAG: TIGR04282 family arsenosugar biosynthesis glycosyltransferase [Thermomicrobiales bacterium]